MYSIYIHVHKKLQVKFAYLTYVLRQLHFLVTQFLLLKAYNMRMILFDKMESYTCKPTMIKFILYQQCDDENNGALKSQF